MNRLNINQARREALFASGLQRSDVLTADALTEVISCTVRRLGMGGCISLMAQEFGDHPEAAAERMRWVRQVADEAFALSCRASGGAGHSGGRGTLPACRASRQQPGPRRLTRVRVPAYAKDATGLASAVSLSG